MNKDMDRRDFLKFLGGSTALVGSGAGLNFLASCTSKTATLKGITPSLKDQLILADGFKYDRLISWRDAIAPGAFFGDNNDFTSFMKINNSEAFLWVNHEYTNPVFSSGKERTLANIKQERKEVGGSILKLIRGPRGWEVKKNDPYNKRIDATTPIPFSNNVRVLGELKAEGTLSNCAGGQTPWGTFLTCEENYDNQYGERAEDGTLDTKRAFMEWYKHFNNPPEHYGWVVEVDPKTGKAQKHTQLGRFSHESATVVPTDKSYVIYSGDDKNYECVYKFVSDEKDKIGKGTLYVANLDKNKWIALDREKHEVLKKNFKSQLEVLMYTRKAARLVGGTPLDRPEDIEQDPISGDIFISLTNNVKKHNFHGSILKIHEKGDFHSEDFSWGTYKTGGIAGEFSCPDNLCFDQNGNLWICTDISGSKINKNPYKPFGNNGLFVIPRSGPHMSEVIQIASAPVDAELTGLSFDHEYKTLFMSVQHPGEKSPSKDQPNSHWPFGKGTPKSSVVMITGEKLEMLTRKKA